MDNMEFFLEAVSACNADVVFDLLDNSKVSVTYWDPYIDNYFYSMLYNHLDHIQEAIKDGDEDAILVYSRVSQYFRI